MTRTKSDDSLLTHWQNPPTYTSTHPLKTSKQQTSNSKQQTANSKKWHSQQQQCTMITAVVESLASECGGTYVAHDFETEYADPEKPLSLCSPFAAAATNSVANASMSATVAWSAKKRSVVSLSPFSTPAVELTVITLPPNGKDLKEQRTDMI